MGELCKGRRRRCVYPRKHAWKLAKSLAAPGVVRLNVGKVESVYAPSGALYSINSIAIKFVTNRTSFEKEIEAKRNFQVNTLGEISRRFRRTRHKLHDSVECIPCGTVKMHVGNQSQANAAYANVCQSNLRTKLARHRRARVGHPKIARNMPSRNMPYDGTTGDSLPLPVLADCRL